MHNILQKRYYRIDFRLASGLAIGSGENKETDKDLVRDSRGIPYIPASALAGIYRSLFCEEAADEYFGNIHNGEARDSKMIVYDAVLQDRLYTVSYRDGVGLDERKTAIDGAKFDFEILEPGVKFRTYIEQDKYEGDVNAGDIVADAWREERIVFGGKVTRGLGRIKDVEIKVCEFSFDSSDEIDKWLKFSLDDEKSFHELHITEELSDSEKEKLRKKQDSFSITLSLKQQSPICIRVYTTKKEQGSSDDTPNFTQLVYNKAIDPKPIIPGTSWAGAFRHQMIRWDNACTLFYFGENGENKDEKRRKSLIWFSESEITKAKWKTVTRNAIDRLSGGTVNRALFKESQVYGGETKLTITVFNSDLKKKFLKCLAAAIIDLHKGIMSIGGETSVGHGLFKIEEISCGESKAVKFDDYPDAELYDKLLGMMLQSCEEV